MSFIEDVAAELNRRAEGRAIGRLQELRRVLHGRDRVVTSQLFDSRTIFDHYAFHVGGRSELQFNIGVESIDSTEYLRGGVAFSLDLNRNLPDIAPLVPKIARFNEFLLETAEELSDLRMWHYADEIRSANYAPSMIPAELVRPKVFVFLGRLQPASQPDFDLILDDFDRLLPLYRFVESADPRVSLDGEAVGFRFTPGCSVKRSLTTAATMTRQLDVVLRHNDLQAALHEWLSRRHGAEAVGTELDSGTPASRTKIDVVLRMSDRYWFYEIKTASSARACIREALAQLLEYSLWPGSQEAERLIIVGEPPLDHTAAAFLAQLRDRFGIPVFYQQLQMPAGALVE